MSHPFLQTDLEIQWNKLTPNHIVPDITKGLEIAKCAIDALCAISESDSDYESVICGLEKALQPLSLAWGKVFHLKAVCDSPEIRKAYNEMLPEVSAFFSSVHLNGDLWKVVKAAAVSESSKRLNSVQKRFLNETVADFVNAGADLDDTKKEQISEIDTKLSALTQKYSENTLDSLNDWELLLDNEERLDGIPENTVETLRKQAQKKGYCTEKESKYLITLHYPIVEPILTYANDSELRKEVIQAIRSIARKEPFDNKPIVKEILTLRHKKAKILGKNNFSDLVLQRSMAKNGETAFCFINEMHDKIESAYKAEINRLEKFVAQKTGKQQGRLNSWDTAYWSQKLRIELYNFDPEELRPYFSMENVLNGMFDITGKLYGIRVVKRTENKPPVWHPDVNYYDVFDTQTREHIGSFYTDWFPRSSKQSGAWMETFRIGDRTEDKHLPHVGLTSGNLTPPVDNKPTLLAHSEVETIFHEFGHLLHLMFSEVKIKSLAGTNVPRDFVEFPSKMSENWCWEREALDIFARHYETGETIPQELFEKMIQSRNFGMASFLMHQLKLGMLDISLHYKYEELKDLDMDEAASVFTKGYGPIVADEVLPMIANFNHLFENPTGYASSYYSYKWAEVLDADAFTRFKEKGVLNKSTGRDFRSTVLSKGNSEDPKKIYQDFMGRNPSPNALLKRLGLI